MSLYFSVKSIMEDKDGAVLKGPLSLFLKGLSLLYRVAALFRNFLYKSGFLRTKRLPIPVISVGNLTVGGTGKTPIVIMIAEMLLNMGIKPAILSRGYKSKAKGDVNIVSNGKTVLMERESAGDEPFMLARRLKDVPVIIGKNRYIAGMEALSQLDIEIFILDDGYQHIKLYRDFNLLLIDSTNPFGNKNIFPRGTLREPLTSMEKADLIVLTKSNGKTKKFSPSCSKKIPVSYSSIELKSVEELQTGKRYPLNSLKNTKVIAVCGIGSPESFKASLETTGCQLAGFHSFPDHYEYTVDDLRNISHDAIKQGAEFIITTEKDAVRLPVGVDIKPEIRFLRINATLREGRDIFEEKLGLATKTLRHKEVNSK